MLNKWSAEGIETTQDITGTQEDVSNREPKSHEILMFVCLQKDAEQCCANAVMPQT